MGSLIKNPGGGLAPTGGYIVGRQDVIDRVSYRLTAPGIGREVGQLRGQLSAVLSGAVPRSPCGGAGRGAPPYWLPPCAKRLGMRSTPAPDDLRTDIIQALELARRTRLIAFCQGIQMASPIDSMALPEPWTCPATSIRSSWRAGTFVSGASIELSADAPMREPYTAFLQGGLTYSHGKLALIRTFEYMQKKGLL